MNTETNRELNEKEIMLRKRQFEETTLIELIYSIEFSVKNEDGNITDIQIQYDIENSIYKASVFYTVWN